MNGTSRHRGAYGFWGFLMGFSMAVFLVNYGGVSRGFLGSLVPEIIGIGVTVGLIERFNRLRAQQDLEDQLKRRMRSSVRDVAVNAVEELKHLGYFYKGTFAGTRLESAQWTGVDLRASWQGGKLLVVNLEKAHMFGAHLERAHLGVANLQEARLFGAHLEGAFLWETNLKRAVLIGAHLQGVHLYKTNLEGADLEFAHLEGVKNVEFAHFDENTVLPDGTKWTPDTDMVRFISPTGNRRKYPFQAFYRSVFRWYGSRKHATARQPLASSE